MTEESEIIDIDKLIEKKFPNSKEIFASTVNLKREDFEGINEKTKKKLILLISRIMERAYRRGVQQTLVMDGIGQIKPWIKYDPYSYRYEKSLAISIGLDDFITTSIDRLFMEEPLHELGFDEENSI